MKTNSSVNSWSNVAVFDELAAGKAVQSFLEGAGFEIRIHDERNIQRYWFCAPPHAAILVQAPAEFAEKARLLLEASPEARPLLRTAIYCPSCHSTRVQYPQMTRKFILPTLFANLLVFLRFMEREYYCEDCHHEWAPSPPQPAANEPLART